MGKSHDRNPVPTVKQATLFDDRVDDDHGSGDLTALPPIERATLTKSQKRFNRLIAKIDAQRLELAQWNAFMPVYQKRVLTEIQPLHERLRDRRKAMVALLDRAMEGRSLGKVQRAKVRDILDGLLSELLEEAQEPELVRLHEKYCDMSFDDACQERADLTRALVSDAFGVELDDTEAAGTPEELARLLADKLRSAGSGPPGGPRPGRRKTAKAIDREALREQAAQGASRAVREVYRKIVGELHPDRELDPGERARKTALMQKVNRAYDEKNLLALLEVQLSIEQIDRTALANMAEERLQHYNLVLEEQSQRLQQELAELTAPFTLATGRPARQLTPAIVLRAIDEDVADIRTGLDGLESDLERFQDGRQLKESLRHYRIASRVEEDWELLAASLCGGRGRGRR